MDDQGAKRLIAAVLKRAYDDFKENDHCPDFCNFDKCESKNVDRNYCTARDFIKSAWAATLCDAIDFDQQKYIEKTTDDGKLTKNIFRYIEAELRDFKRTVQEYEILRLDIINSSPNPDITGVHAGTSNPTEVKATAVIMNKKLTRLEGVVKAVRLVYSNLERDKQRFIELKYWGNSLTDEGIARSLYITGKTLYRWKKSIIYAIARELGYL